MPEKKLKINARKHNSKGKGTKANVKDLKFAKKIKKLAKRTPKSALKKKS